MARTCDAFPEGFEILEIKIIILHYTFYFKKRQFEQMWGIKINIQRTDYRKLSFSGFTFFLPYTSNFRYRGW